MERSKEIRILYMEEDEGLARLIQKKLARNGFIVDIALNGKEGLALYDKGSYDVVAVDNQMPLMSGLEVIRTLSLRGLLPPTVVITGAGSEKIAVEAMKLGAHDYIVKDASGYYIELLPTVIENVMYRAHLVKEKKRLELDLMKEQREKEAILNSIPEMVISLDKDLNILWANRAAAQMSGKKSQHVINRPCHDVFVCSLCDGERCPVEETIETKKEHEKEIESPDGRIWTAHCYPILDEKGEVDGVVEVREEITSRRIAEESLKETKELFRLLTENAKDFIYRYRFLPIRGFEYVSPSAAKITGYTPEELYSDPNLFLALIHPQEQPRMQGYLERPEIENGPFTLRFVTKDGTEGLVEQNIVPILSRDKTLIAIEGIARDITGRR